VDRRGAARDDDASARGTRSAPIPRPGATHERTAAQPRFKRLAAVDYLIEPHTAGRPVRRAALFAER
jgi:hypothetical protein